MARHGKRYREAREKVDRSRRYEVEEAVQDEGEVAEGSQTELPAEETDPGETGKEQGGS